MACHGAGSFGFVVDDLALSRASPLPQGWCLGSGFLVVCWGLEVCSGAPAGSGSGANGARPRLFGGHPLQSRCWEINLEISTIEVRPVNSNFTLPNDEK